MRASHRRRTAFPLLGATIIVGSVSSSSALAAPGLETFVMATSGQSNYSTYGVPSVVGANFGNFGVSIPANASTDPTILASDGIAGTYRTQSVAGGILSDATTITGSGVSQFGSWTYSGSTSTSVQSGQIKSVSTATHTGNSDNGTVNSAESYSIMRETLSVNSPGFALGSTGTMLIETSFSGALSVNGTGTAGVILRYGYGNLGSTPAINQRLLETFGNIYGNGYQIYGPHSSSGSFVVPPGFGSYNVGPTQPSGAPSFLSFGGSDKVYASIPISFDQGFEYAMGLMTFTGVGNGNGVMSSDFSHTATITGIRILDSGGNPVNDFTITSGSGTVYNANGVQLNGAAAPEPGSLALMGISLVSLGIIVRRRARTPLKA